MLNPEKHVLIVDDDARNIFALNAVIKVRGIKTISVLSMHEAFEILEKNKQVGIILLDMMMPEMDGYEAISKIKANEYYKNILIVAVTAQAMPGDKERCIAAGADEYISKPVDVDLLFKYLAENLK